MGTHRTPGVYIEEQTGGARPVERVSTNTTLFVGFTRRGPIDRAVRISSWAQYVEQFGAVVEGASVGISDLGDRAAADYMGHAVLAYFRNGGQVAYIRRVVDGAAPATTSLAEPIARTFEAVDPGTWADGLELRLGGLDAPGTWSLAIGRGDGDDFATLEHFPAVSDDPSRDDFIGTVLERASALVRLVNDSGEPLTPSAAAGTRVAGAQHSGAVLHRGADGGLADVATFRAAFEALEHEPDINVICTPGATWAAATDTEHVAKARQPVVEAALSHCEKMKNRVLIVDPPANHRYDTTEDLVTPMPRSALAQLYYPWLTVTDPLDDVERQPDAPRAIAVPPSGFVAGIWSRIDVRKGVWQAPAGLETALNDVIDVAQVVDDAEQDVLNDRGVNVIRSKPGLGIVVWGTRTLAPPDQPEWTYIPVRRTAIMIEESLRRSIQWAVFEPNNPALWRRLRVSIESFMNELFRAGAFQGTTPSDAYWVACGLDETMKQHHIDTGYVIVEVGYAPLKPAEFVVLQIHQLVGQS